MDRQEGIRLHEQGRRWNEIWRLEVGRKGLEAGLEERLASGDVRELILATSATVEGEATAAFLAGIGARAGVLASRIAHGVPMGGELEFVDSSTLSLALAARTAMRDE